MSDAASVRRRAGRRPRGGDAALLRRVTEAIVDGEPIQWEGVERSARSGHVRRVSRQLHLLATMTPAHPPPRPATETGSARLPGLLAALAAVQVASGLAIWLLTAAPTALAGQAALVASSGAAAVVVGTAHRTRVAPGVPVVLWLLGALAARPLLVSALTPMPATLLATAWAHLPVEAALPWALWTFACGTPGVARFGRLDRLCRSVMGAAIAWSALLAVATLVEAFVPDGGVRWLRPVWAWRLQDTGGPGQLALLGWAVAAAIAMVTRAYHTRRSAAFGPQAAWGVASLGGVAWWLAAHQTGPSAVLADTSLAPGGEDRWPWIAIALVAPWVAALPVVASRLTPGPDSPAAGVRPRLATPGRLAASAALVVLGVRLTLLREQTLTDSSGDAVVMLAAGMGGVLLLTHAGWRRWAGGGWRGSGWRGAPEALIAELTADLRHARSPREVAGRVTAHVAAAVEGASVAVLFPGPAGWQTVVGPTITLAHDSALAAMLAGVGDAPLRLGAGASLRRLLPLADRAWLDQHAVHLLVPIAALDGPPRAALLVARTSTGATPGRAAVAFASVVAATTAMALERCAALAHVETPEDVGFECPTCGRLDQAPGPCVCGAARCLSALPTMFDHRYRLERRLGRGGMGVVYAARDVALGRAVALKTLPRAHAADALALQVEAQAMAAISHPAVAILYGLERWRGTPVLVMEYFERGTLADLVARGPVPWRHAVDIGAALAHTLADLHGRHWVHRDIKPANIAFDDEGRPVLLDFGLTRLLDGVALRTAPHAMASPVEVTPALAGTRAYLSPDALAGADVGPHDDVWALATVICELLLGHPPCEGAMETSARVEAPLRAAGVPEPLIDVLGRALHPCIDRRTCRADDLAHQLAVASRRVCPLA